MLNQRVIEAESLRGFFQDQWDHLQQLIDRRQQKRMHERQETGLLNHAVEILVTGTDGRLRAVSHYQEQLRQSTRSLLRYIEDMVAELPPPLLLTRQTFVMDPTVRSLFQDERLIEKLFHEQRTLDNFLEHQTEICNEVHALIHLFKTEKQVLGTAMWGEMLVSGVPQTVVCFVGHEIIDIKTNETDLRSALKRTLFDSVVIHLRLETTRIRHERTDEKSRQDALDPDQNIDNPKVYLSVLQQLMASPKQLLSLNREQITIDKMGIKISSVRENSMTSTDTIDLQELSIGNRRSRILCMVRYPLDRRSAPQQTGAE